MEAKQIRVGRLFAGTALLALLAPSFAAAQAPAGSTAQCGDGTYSTAASKRGACSGHGGIKVWLADKKAAPAAAKAAAKPAAMKPAAPPKGMPKPAAAAPAGATGICGDGTYTQAKSVRGACSGHGGVKQWLQAPTAPAPTAGAPARPPVNVPPAKGKPAAAPKAPVSAANATALCNDGTYSDSQHKGGTCSQHGGVKQWLKDVPK